MQICNFIAVGDISSYFEYLPSRPVYQLLGGREALEDLEAQNPPTGTDDNGG